MTITIPLLNSEGQWPRSQRDLNLNLLTPNPVLFGPLPTPWPLPKRRCQVPGRLEKLKVEREPQPGTSILGDTGVASCLVSSLERPVVSVGTAVAPLRAYDRWKRGPRGRIILVGFGVFFFFANPEMHSTVPPLFDLPDALICGGCVHWTLLPTVNPDQHLESSKQALPAVGE